MFENLESIGDVESQFEAFGIDVAIGVDEVGMGPLAGPVTAAALLYDGSQDNSEWLRLINDSKKLTESRRLKAMEGIRSNATYRYVHRGPRRVEEVGINAAAREAMVFAVKDLVREHRNLTYKGYDLDLDLVMVDGNGKPLDLPYRQVSIVKGDQYSYHIGAASIVAKQARDELMRSAHLKWPEYGFDSNKGYGTKAHISAIEEHGPCPVHRLNYGRVKEHADRLRED